MISRKFIHVKISTFTVYDIVFTMTAGPLRSVPELPPVVEALGTVLVVVSAM